MPPAERLDDLAAELIQQAAAMSDPRHVEELSALARCYQKLAQLVDRVRPESAHKSDGNRLSSERDETPTA